MKKTLIALAVTSIAATSAMADETSKVFGEMKYEMGIYDGAGEHSVRGTRFGVKGSSDLGNGLTGKYIIMGNTGSSLGSGSLGLNENNYVALAGGFGEVRFGRADTPMKEAIKPFRAFTDTIADDDFAKPARWARADGVHFQTKMGDMKVHLNYSPNGSEMNSNMAASVIYKAGDLYVSAALEVIGETLEENNTNDAWVTDEEGYNNMSAGAHYKMGALGAGVLYQSLNDGDNSEITIPVTFKMTEKMKLNAAVMLSSYKTEVFDDGTSKTGTDYAVGAEYFFDKKTKFFANVWSGDRTQVSRVEDSSASAALKPESSTGIGFGMSRKF